MRRAFRGLLPVISAVRGFATRPSRFLMLFDCMLASYSAIVCGELTFLYLSFAGTVVTRILGTRDSLSACYVSRNCCVVPQFFYLCKLIF